MGTGILFSVVSAIVIGRSAIRTILIYQQVRKMSRTDTDGSSGTSNE